VPSSSRPICNSRPCCVSYALWTQVDKAVSLSPSTISDRGHSSDVSPALRWVGGEGGYSVQRQATKFARGVPARRAPSPRTHP
jgi:hypothetical protein